MDIHLKMQNYAIHVRRKRMLSSRNLFTFTICSNQSSGCVTRPSAPSAFVHFAKFNKYSPRSHGGRFIVSPNDDGCRRDLSTSAWILDSRRDDGRLRDATVAPYSRDKYAPRRSGAMRRCLLYSCHATGKSTGLFVLRKTLIAPDVCTWEKQALSFSLSLSLSHSVILSLLATFVADSCHPTFRTIDLWISLTCLSA